MVIKIDLEKAYDKVRWDFLEQTLDAFNFPRQLINLIMHCVTSSSPQILWNGMALPPLKPKCGLRQGDPLSPYLFVLCMERLSHIIEAAVRERNWQPIQPCREGPKFSHLFFADDLIFFTKASHDNARKIKLILDSFCTHSGLLVNKHKSKIFFSKNVGNRRKRDLANCLEMSSTNNIGKYLGVPRLHERVKTSTFKEVIDRILSKLSSWKARWLNLAGRTTLIQSVTLAIPAYAMQTSWLPTSVCNRIDRINHTFLWGGEEGAKRKIHLVKWDTVTKGKKEGGLGIKDSRDEMIWTTAPSTLNVLLSDDVI
ncbi:hypothetical protein BUALT_Bualt07G0040500 [Buddleja alternifolia]|uniref:Reverse transcriptase domain-containing protein n=1 Tax=Buddleja alternifolia TaxID=168488 RepID=A0AAV6XG13_9LAMI|nr:hypothetical protein BUALT_Bualt07G0040500 [Buddleja alternifolia]